MQVPAVHGGIFFYLSKNTRKNPQNNLSIRINFYLFFSNKLSNIWGTELCFKQFSGAPLAYKSTRNMILLCEISIHILL